MRNYNQLQMYEKMESCTTPGGGKQYHHGTLSSSLNEFSSCPFSSYILIEYVHEVTIFYIAHTTTIESRPTI